MAFNREHSKMSSQPYDNNKRRHFYDIDKNNETDDPDGIDIIINNKHTNNRDGNQRNDNRRPTNGSVPYQRDDYRRPNNQQHDRRIDHPNGSVPNHQQNNRRNDYSNGSVSNHYHQNDRYNGSLSNNYQKDDNNNRRPTYKRDLVDDKIDSDNDSDKDNEYNDINVKNKLITYIYNKMDVSRYKYRILEFEKDLVQLKNTKYISPNYNGINSLMVFMKIKDKYYSYTIDRRTLKYNQNQLDIANVRLVPISIRLDESIYNGTIFDGVILYNNPNKDNKRRKKIYVINDIYMFQGNYCTAEIMPNKIMNINAYLNSNYKKDDLINNTELVVNTVYELKDMSPLVNTNIPKSIYKNSIKGIAFFPERSGTKLIYLYSNCSVKPESSDEGVKMVTGGSSPTDYHKEKIEIRQPKIITTTLDENFEATFRMKKSDTIDVYTLYLAQAVDGTNGKKCVKYIKFGIAYIQTIESSYFCKDLFEAEEKDAVLVKCKYNPDKNKWVPFAHVTDKKIPDYYDKINKYFIDNNYTNN